MVDPHIVNVTINCAMARLFRRTALYFARACAIEAAGVEAASMTACA
jgi:hypothetical protein